MKRFATIFLLMLIWIGPAIAQNDGRAHTTPSSDSRWLLELAPDDQPYPDYIADPRRPRTQVGFGVADSDIPQTSASRIMLDLGTRYTLFKLTPMEKGHHWFTLDIEGGVFTQFDPGNGLDNIGWDGRYGIFTVWDWSDRLVARIGYRHISSHLGDEYIEATGRRRVNYTRDDLAFGLSYALDGNLLIYVEPRWAGSMGNEDRQKRLAAEGGIQYQGPRNIWKDSTAFYAAAHIRVFDETDWNPGVNLQTGFHVKRNQQHSSLRLGLDGYIGRALLGEFALDNDEAYLTAFFSIAYH